jgi:hypothetical protein
VGPYVAPYTSCLIVLAATCNIESNTIEIGYDVMKGTEYLVSLYASVVITQEYSFMVNNEELIGATEHLAL